MSIKNSVVSFWCFLADIFTSTRMKNLIFDNKVSYFQRQFAERREQQTQT
jgi:hypothetical protein